MLGLGASWKTTVIGFVAAILQYFANMGANLPSDAHGWGVAFVSAALFAWGLVMKDSNVSNATNPTAAKPVPDAKPTT